MTSNTYSYGGARALVALHAQHLREFLVVWRRADELGVQLPTTKDPSYASRDVLLVHVLSCAAGYLLWICKQIDVEAPKLNQNPEPAGFSQEAQAYMEEVLTAWEQPLRAMTEDQADRQVFTSDWGVPYTIDAMLEHAVMHPIRHSYQLQHLMGE